MIGRPAGRLLAVVLAAVALTACGRAGKPRVPSSAEYPLHYPDPTLAPSQAGTAGSEAVFVDPSVGHYGLLSPGGLKRTHESPLGPDDPEDTTTANPIGPGTTR